MGKTELEILDAIPPKRPRSKLEPHYDLIRELRRRSTTYREIAKILQDHIGLKVDHTTVRDFVHLRARRAKVPRLVEELPPRTCSHEPPRYAVESGAPAPAQAAPRPPASTADAYARIESLKRRKPAPKPVDPAFHFEEGTPLRLISDPNQND